MMKGRSRTLQELALATLLTALPAVATVRFR